MSEQPDIIYTKVDEAPELASGSFLPIIQSFAGVAGIRSGQRIFLLQAGLLRSFQNV